MSDSLEKTDKKEIANTRSYYKPKFIKTRDKFISSIDELAPDFTQWVREVAENNPAQAAELLLKAVSAIYKKEILYPDSDNDNNGNKKPGGNASNINIQFNIDGETEKILKKIKKQKISLAEEIEIDE